LILLIVWGTLVLIIGGGKFILWPGILICTCCVSLAYKWLLVIEETECLTVATSAFIFSGAPGIKKFSLDFILCSNGYSQL